MSKQWRLTLAATVACVLAVALAQANSGQAVGDEVSAPPAAERNLESVRVDTDATGRPVVRLEATGALEYESFVLDGPDRLVLDLPGVVSRLDDYRYPVSQGGVVQVRAGQHHLEPYPLTRVVFDLEGPLAYNIERRDDALVVAFGDAPAGRTRLTAAEPVVEAASEPVAAVQPEQLDRVVEEMTARIADPAPAAPPQAEPIAESDWKAALDTAPQEPVETASRSVEPAEIERLLNSPNLAAPVEPQAATYGAPETRTVIGQEVAYTGRRISLNLVDADIKQVFRLFHEISGLNFVLDPGVSGRVTVVLDQVPWDQALDLILKNNGLDKVVEQNVLRIASTQKLAQEAAARKALKEAEEMEIELTTLTRTLSYAKAKDVQDMLSGQQQGGGGGRGGRGRGLLSDRAMVIMDERTNTLIITDIPKNIAALDQLITTLDSETPQVMIEARIVETSRSYTRNLGVNWGFSALADASRGTATSLEFPHNASARYGLNLSTGGASLLEFNFGNVIDSLTLDLALDALETEGEGRILSAPKIATQNNEMAQIEQGVRIPIVNTTATEINVEFVSASLRLEVTPQITAEGTVVLDVIVENNSPDFVQTAGDIPSIKTQRAETKVLVSDGGTTVIGGIFTVNEGQSELGVPWFRKIPGLGWLFRSQSITNENRELLIFITPKIVKLG